jgi:hypothetical protein
MSRIDYFILCETAIYDAQQRFTLVNTFNQLKTEGLPTLATKFTLAFSILLEEEDFASDSLGLSLKVTSPSGKVILKAEGTGNVASVDRNEPIKLLHNVFDLGTKIGFEEEGVHTATLSVSGKEISSRQFIVTVTANPADPTQTTEKEGEKDD